LNPSNDDPLFDDEESGAIVAFHEYPGGPPIVVQTRGTHINDDLEPEVIEQRAHFPAWSMAQHQLMPGHVIIASQRARVLISRELELAARHQLYARYRQLGIELPWLSKIPQRKAVLVGHENEWLSQKLTKESFSEVTARKPDGDMRKLEDRIKFLEAQLQSQKPYSQLYRLGAGSLFVSVISLLVWLLTGTGIPFHPIFAAGVVPVSICVIVMAFSVRPKKQTNNK
jgi:hypothetical protein